MRSTRLNRIAAIAHERGVSTQSVLLGGFGGRGRRLEVTSDGEVVEAWQRLGRGVRQPR